MIERRWLLFGLLSILGCGGDSTPETEWAAGLVVSPVEGTTSYLSSSKLRVSWTSSGGNVDHYEIRATDQIGGSKVELTVGVDETSAVLTGLRSGTVYQVSIAACRAADCSNKVDADGTAEGTTAEEYWRIQGTGNSYETALEIVADSNTKPHAFLYGEGAPAELEGKIRLYFDPSIPGEKGVAVAVSQSVESFTRIEGTGLITTGKGDQSRVIRTFQAVPVTADLGGNIHLFVEALGDDGAVRLVRFQSEDGWLGHDFHPGQGSLCEGDEEYLAGGDCIPEVVLGSEGNPGVTNVRQSKIGYPILDDWRWDGAAGTFMVATVDWSSDLNLERYSKGYAVWDGSKWALQYNDDGTPKVFPKLQAPLPLHVGGVRYKMYANYHTGTEQSTSPGQATMKPVRLLYADGALTGDPGRVDFEDWESVEDARTVHFLWPDGTELSEEDKSRLDDYVVLYPTGDSDYQVMYSNMSTDTKVFIGMAVLLNP